MPILCSVDENTMFTELFLSTKMRRTSTSRTLAVISSTSWWGRVILLSYLGPKVMGVVVQAGSSVGGNEAKWLMRRAYAHLLRLEGNVCVRHHR